MKNFAIVISRYNTEITNGLLAGAREYLLEQNNSTPDIVDAPGAFELPLLAQALARSGKYSGVICLGCVIKGDTAHFEYISLAAAMGIQQASLATEVPIGFGVLTTYTEEQALLRSRPGKENKGREAASAVYQSALVLDRLQNTVFKKN